MNDQTVEQALFGYADGHRLLASSVPLDSVVSRLLRSATDMTFEAGAKSYSTLIPLPSMKVSGFVRTWPAYDWVRAGSVWSHVLFVDWETLGRLGEPARLTTLFRRPKPGDRSLKGELPKYSHPLEIPSRSSASDFDRDLAVRVLSELYSTVEPVTVGWRGAPSQERLIYELLGQQWPRLRRSFATRTRARRSESSWRVDLELVEKDPKTAPTFDLEPEWVRTLLSDLVRPEPALRAFFARYGGDSTSGRLAMRDLTMVASAVRAGDQALVVSLLRERFSNKDDARTLKRDLLGLATDDTPQGWVRDEANRIRIAFAVGAAADFTDLHLARRILELAATGRSGESLKSLPLEGLDPTQVAELVGELGARAELSSVARLATSSPDLGALVASRRPEILGIDDVWEALDPELALDVIAQIAPDVRDAVIAQLVSSNAIRPLALICERDRSSWWRAVVAVGTRAKSPRDIVLGASVLRSVLDRIGAASLEGRGSSARNPRQLAATLLSADMASGLWRRYSFDEWKGLLQATRKAGPVHGLPRYALDRILAVTLLSGLSAGSAAVRVKAWALVFAELHMRLEDPAFDGEAWQSLANSLPTGDEWDRCLRLRRGVAAEIRRDHWAPSDVESFLVSAADAGSEVRQILAASEPKRRQTVRDLIAQFFS